MKIPVFRRQNYLLCLIENDTNYYVSRAETQYHEVRSLQREKANFEQKIRELTTALQDKDLQTEALVKHRERYKSFSLEHQSHMLNTDYNTEENAAVYSKQPNTTILTLSIICVLMNIYENLFIIYIINELKNLKCLFNTFGNVPFKEYT